MTPPNHNICVFCGASPAAAHWSLTEAKRLGRGLAKHNFGLVYGGASTGLMGCVAEGALEENGFVVGVWPTPIADREPPMPGLSRLIEVQTMHERKAKMNALSSAFLALPGGFGTLDELFETLTWAQIGIHKKPCLLVNTNGFFDGLLAFFQRANIDGLLRTQHLHLCINAHDSEDAIRWLNRYFLARLPTLFDCRAFKQSNMLAQIRFFGAHLF